MKRLALLALLCLGSALAEARLEGRTLRYEEGPEVLWSRTFANELGEITAPLPYAGLIFVGVGPEVFAYTPTGALEARYDLPAYVTALDASGNVLRVSVQGDGYSDYFTLNLPEEGGGARERVVFPPDPEITTWLARAAELVPEREVPRAAQEDPLNPFLQLRLAQQTDDDFERLGAVRRTLTHDQPFPVWVQLAVQLEAAGYPSPATTALERAKRDAAARGYDPEIAIGREALSSYGNPSNYAATLLAQNRMTRAEVWIRYLRELHPRLEGGEALFGRYADTLERLGRSGEAEEWRQFTRSLRSGTLYNLGESGPTRTREVARLSTFTLLLTLLAALITLHMRCWNAQLEATRPYGGRWKSWLTHPIFRAQHSTLAYTSYGERLILLSLAAGLVMSLAGWQWSNMVNTRLQQPVLNMGTYGGGWYQAHLSHLQLRVTPETTFLSALAAQMDDDTTTARSLYAKVKNDACAANNLGVISAGRENLVQARLQYRNALSLRPDLPAPAYNLGLSVYTPGSIFQKTYRPEEPRLCFPDARNLIRATTGDLSATLWQNLRQPLAFLQEPPETHRLGWAFVGGMSLMTLFTLLFLVPRPRTALAQGRGAAYRLSALTFPGAAFLSGAWGVVLLLAWGALVMALLVGLSPLMRRLISLPMLSSAQLRPWLYWGLGGVYLTNLAAFVVAETVFFRQKRHLAEDLD